MQEHGTAVLRLCRALLPAHEADDAWSEAFLSALLAYPDLPAGANVQAWLVTIARRKAIDRLRAAARAADPVADPPESAAPVVDAHEHDELRAAVAALPPAQRDAITLHYLADLPYAAVAAVVGGTEAAARRAAADGMRTLRRRIPGGPDER